MGVKIKTLSAVRYKGVEYEKDEVIEIDDGVYRDWVKIGLCTHGDKIPDEKLSEDEADDDGESSEGDGADEPLTDEELLEAHVEEVKGNWYIFKSGEKVQGKESAIKRIKELIE